MKRTVSPYLLVFLTLCVVNSLEAQNQPPIKLPPSQSSDWDIRPFNIDAEKLPSRYFGHPLAFVSDEVANRDKVKKKDEFETTTEYRARIEKLDAQPLWRELTASSLWAFAIPYDGESSYRSPLNASYNADLSILTVVLNMSGAYTGLVVKQTDEERSSLFLPSQSLRQFAEFRSSLDGNRVVYRDSTQVPLKISMERDIARRAKPNLAVLLIGNIGETQAYTSAVTLNLQQIWLYDLATGTVFARIKPTPEPEPVVTPFPLETTVSPIIPCDIKPTSSQPGQPVEVGQLAYKATQKRSPSYPTIARNARVTGQVKVFLELDEQGGIARVKCTEGPVLLQRAAEDAARGWKFAQTLIDGKPVRVKGFIVFYFAL